MSKMRCKCGGVVVDQTDSLPNKGAIIRDQDQGGLESGLVRDINSFIDSLLQGKRDEWIYENYLKYCMDDRPAEAIKNDEVLGLILSRHIAYQLCIYQCMSCGGIMIETDPFSNTFASFSANKWEEGTASILQARKEPGVPNFKLL